MQTAHIEALPPSSAAPDFAAVFLALPVAMAVFAADAPQFTLLAANDALLAVTQRTRESLVGRPLAEAFPDPSPGGPHEGGLQDLWASLAAAVQTGVAQDMARQRYDLQRPDGTWETRYWDCVNAPLPGPDGVVRHLLHQTTEVTALVRAEVAEAQAASAERGAARILERMGDSHCVLDREFRFVGVNAAAERLLGRARETLLGRSNWEAFPASAHAPVGAAYRRVVADGIEQHLTHHYVGEGYDLHLEMDAYPTEEGGVAIFWRDVTERVKAETRLRLLAARDAYRLALTDALRSADDPVEAQAVATRVLGDHLGASRVMYGEADPGSTETFTNHREYRRDPTMPTSLGAHHWDDFGAYVATEMRAGRTLVVDEVGGHPGHTPDELAAYEAVGIRAYVAVPLVRGGRIVAYLAVNHTTPHAWTDDEIALTEETAERTWAAVERARAEAARRASEERYRALFEQMDEAYAVVELIADAGGRWADFRFLEVNQAFMRHTGMPYPVGRTATELLGTPNPRWAEFYGRAADTGESIRVEETELTLGRAFDLNIFRLGGAGSRRVAVLFRDVTARKQAEEELRRSEERQGYLVRLGDVLRRLAEPAVMKGQAMQVVGEHLRSDGAIYVEVDAQRAEYVVEGAWRRGGVTSDGRRFPVAAWPMPWLASGRPWVVRDAETDPAVPDEQRASCRANDVGACVVVPLLEDGRLIAALFVTETTPRDWTAAEIGLLEDTAERTWAAVERARAEEALKESDRRKDEFLAMLGHELRNPLAPIRTASALLDKKLGTTPELQPLLGVLARQTAQLARLVDDLLDVARLTHARVALRFEPVEWDAVIDQAIETVRTLAAEKAHDLRVHRPGEKLYVSGDHARLVQTVTNLLNNAIKYTDPHGTITLTASATEQEVVLSVQDTGLGISPELLPQVFDLFVQSDRSLDRSQGGLGIGLSVARHLVAMHHGTLQARSAGLGQGSTFEIRLPRIAAPSRAEETVVTPGRPRHILIVDDNRDAADILAMMLTNDGHEVDVVYRSTDALACVAQQHPDVVLLDIGMPEMDGYAVVRALRAHHGNGVRVLALTGYGQPEDRERTRAAGFDAHLVKPVDVQTLRSHLAG